MSGVAMEPRRRMALPRLRMPSWGGAVGAVLFVFVVGVALVGPAFAPHNPSESFAIPGSVPSSAVPLGADFLGRDVLSRVLWGGRSTLLLGGVSTVLVYVVGITFGLVAGYAQGFRDQMLMRIVDLVLSFPALLLMLLLVTAMGGSAEVLVLGCVIVLFPGVARIVRTATLEVAQRAYVEAALARGESTVSILRREILPNIKAPIVADLGIRFSWAIILIASVNFLGLGLQPPTPDWGLMVSENRQILTSNPYAVVAPAAMIGILIVAVNLLGDAYVRRLGRREEES